MSSKYNIDTISKRPVVILFNATLLNAHGTLYSITYTDWFSYHFNKNMHYMHYTFPELRLYPPLNLQHFGASKHQPTTSRQTWPSNSTALWRRICVKVLEIRTSRVRPSPHPNSDMTWPHEDLKKGPAKKQTNSKYLQVWSVQQGQKITTCPKNSSQLGWWLSSTLLLPFGFLRSFRLLVSNVNQIAV